MLRKSIFIVFLIGLCLDGLSQYVDKNDYAQKVFPAIKSQVANENYAAALENLRTLDSLFPANPVFCYYLGLCYLNIPGNKGKATSVLAIAAKFANKNYKEGDYRDYKAPPLSVYLLARAYHLDYKIDSAIANYNRYRQWVSASEVETLKDIDHQIEQCNNARQIFANPVNTKIENLGPVINTKYDEYTPVLDALETTLIFTSRRPETTGGGIADDGKYFEDIYISNKINGQWNKPISIGSNINTEGHEATISLSADGEQLYIYRDDMGDGNIYMSKFNGDIWGKPVKLEPTVNSGARETHASVSADNNTLYFTSDREGGYGGLDIYMSKRLPNGEWGKITNLGPTINTKYDEEGPFVHPDGNTLFFSSKGHNSIGGFDIFFSVRQPDGSWIPPQNMGYPINTPDDEYFFVTSTDGKRAYFASSQPGGYGGKDIYVINLEMDPEIPLTVYKGFISSENNIVPSDVEITVTESSNPDEPYGIYRPNPRTGKFILILPSGKNYNIAYQAKGYLFFSENLNVPIETSYFVINKEIELKPIKPKGR